MGPQKLIFTIFLLKGLENYENERFKIINVLKSNFKIKHLTCSIKIKFYLIYTNMEVPLKVNAIKFFLLRTPYAI